MLGEVRRGELADRALNRALDDIPQRERAFAQELTYGVLRMRSRLDYRLSKIATRPLDTIDADAMNALRLGAYQLLELNGIPPYAAVSESVELVKPRGQGLAGFVNGVLKGLQRSEAPRYPDPRRDAVGYLSTWGSHPRWLAQRWVNRFGAHDATMLVEANNRRPELCLQPLQHDLRDAIALLEQNGMTAEPLRAPASGIRLTHGDVATALSVLPAIVQDPAARLVTLYVGAQPNDVVLDVCAAPGGKAVGLAHASRFTAAADVSFARLARVAENVARLRGQGARLNAGLVVADARHSPFGSADIVFVDAPCTGTGTLRRHPDGRWRVALEDIATLVALQRDILMEAATCVKPGGFLVYATCSLEPEENEEQMDWFLDVHPQFEAAPRAASFPVPLRGDGSLHVLPQLHGYDGAFAMRLRRKK